MLRRLGNLHGYYPTDQALEDRCVLLQAGALFQNTLWSKDGKAILTFVEKHAFLSQYHVFASYMDNVLLANTLTRGEYTSMVTAMEQVAVNKALYTAGHGYLDQETADWKPLVLQSSDNAGETEDWVSTEAMSIALQAVQSLPMSTSDDFSSPVVLPAVGG